MKSRKKIKSRKASLASSKKPPSRRRGKKNAASEVSLFDHRAVEHRFIAEHPDAFDPFIGEWVVLEGTSIVAHDSDPAVAVDHARNAGIKVPYVFWVEPKLNPNQGRLGL
jgi:hypothetical protein